MVAEYYDLSEVLGFCAVILLVIWCYRYVTKPYASFPTYALVSNLIWGHLSGKVPRNILSTEIYFQEFVSLSERYRSEGLFLIWLPNPFLVIFNEKAIKTFLSEPACIDKTSAHSITNDLFGKGLISSNGSTWKKQRKMLNPVFHTDMLKDRIFTFNEYADELVRELSKAEDTSCVDIYEHLKLCSFQIMCESILGLKMMNKQNKDNVRIMTSKVARMAEIMLYRVITPWLRSDFVFSLTSASKEYRELRDAWNNFTLKMTSEIRESAASQELVGKDPSENRKSFVHILLECSLKDPSFTPKNLQDQVKTFMTAGFETTATTMMWCLYLLGLHPDVQEQVYSEVMSVTDQFVTYDQLSQLQYLENVIMETLRVYPTVPIMARELKRDVQYEKYKVPKGTNIVFFIYALHRNPEIYPYPETFDPDRFQESSGKRDFSHIPFSAGLRNCIGKKFAMMEMKIILSYIIRKFKITSLNKREDIKLHWVVSLMPTQPILLQLTPRQYLNKSV